MVTNGLYGISAGMSLPSRLQTRQDGGSVKEYEIYVPLVAPSGKRFPASLLTQLKKRLVARFGGLTYSPQKNEGYWRVEKAIFYDEIVILRVISPADPATRAFWKSLKKEMQQEWKQTAILIVCREIKII